MEAALQTRVQLLGAVFIAFILLAGPMFVQVKADRSESLARAGETMLAQWGREFAGTWQPRDPSSLTVEDYWGEQARENNPECGAECDPDGDMDGDGISNADELEAGRNPACDEEAHGHAFCQGQDNSTLVDPEDPNATIEPRFDPLFDETWQPNGNGPPVTFTFESLDYHYDRFVIILNGTARDHGFRVSLANETMGELWSYQENAPNPLVPGGSQSVNLNATVSDAHPGLYEVTFEVVPSGLFQEPPDARLRVFGQLDAR